MKKLIIVYHDIETKLNVKVKLIDRPKIIKIDIKTFVH